MLRGVTTRCAAPVLFSQGGLAPRKTEVASTRAARLDGGGCIWVLGRTAGGGRRPVFDDHPDHGSNLLVTGNST